MADRFPRHSMSKSGTSLDEQRLDEEATAASTPRTEQLTHGTKR